ncbi:MAG TPA: hypothetical protein VHY84_03695 [Bryobacteraceae bacterium]|jgi:hypothetical protein|nr:hypothetical protein [Bryobacteraceae bacterium]
MRWTARISEPELSTHQRLIARVFVEVDGSELARRRGKGQFLVLVQVNDEKGGVWQNHQEMDLERVEEGIKANDALFSQIFFVLPGEYRISIAIFDNATKEHSIVTRKLHVAPLKNDPLPGAWSDLPAIEFLPPPTDPDRWYLPTIEGKLRLAVETHEPVHVSLLVNLTPSERSSGSTRVQNRNFEVLLPAAKLLSQADWGNAAYSVSLLDLARRRVIYGQDDAPNLPRNARGMDWSRLDSALTDVNPGMIDVKSLENRQHSADFFIDQIRRSIEEPSGRRRSQVVIVLSSMVQFEPGQELRPIPLTDSTDVKLFYVRFESRSQFVPGPAAIGRRGRPGNGRWPSSAPYPGIDQLEPLLKPLEPRLFQIGTQDEFRKALATILARIAQL